MSDEINVNSVPLPQNLATLGQVKDALDQRDKKIDSLKEDIGNWSTSEIHFNRFEKDFKNVFNRTEYDDGIVSKETTYSENTAESLVL